MTVLSPQLNRRAFLGSASTMALAGCAGCPDFPALAPLPAPRPLADAHVHLFNAADLPVARFLKYVIGMKLKKVPAVLISLVSFLGSVVKLSAMTASAEMKLRVPPWQQGSAGLVTASEFAAAAADHIEGIVRTTDPALLLDTWPLGLLPEGGAGANDALGDDLAERFDRAGEGPEIDDETRVSTVVLAALLAEWSARISGRPSPFAKIRAAEAVDADAAVRSILQNVVPVDRFLLEAILTDPLGEGRAGVETLSEADVPRILQDRLGPARLGQDSLAALKIDVGAVLRWVFKMRQTRCRHVAQFLEFADAAAPELQVRQCINLLVDYDEWLSERPLPGSDHADQVRFWTQMAAVTRDRLTIHTFAGYDPLKDTYGRLGAGGTSPYLAELLQWFENGKMPDAGQGLQPQIAGLKLYPVMGFNPNSGNYLPTPKYAGRRVRRKWNNAHPQKQFGPELDATLDAFFSQVAVHDIPLFTHARQSNHATEYADQYGNLVNWHARACRHWTRHQKPLRLCLGHFTLGDTQEDAFEAIMCLNRQGRARIYIDIAYGLEHGTPLNSTDPAPERAAKYMAGLRAYAQKYDPDYDFILFGSDWIMLEQEPGASMFVPDAWHLFAKHSAIGPELAHKIFVTNFDRFLAPAAVNPQQAMTAPGCKDRCPH
jgi:hypothetical protein